MADLDLKFLQDIVLTPGQAKALEMVRTLKGTQRQDPVTGVLTGYAGTGKTTMLRILVKELGSVVVVTPTGKAAVRVTEATGLPASTIHRWLYTSKKNVRTGETEWTLKKASEFVRPDSGLVVVDEASMVDEALWMHIYEACQMIRCNVLLVGDPYQLPPVTKGDDGRAFSLLGPSFPADFRAALTEVQRQALDSPIIRASMKIRNGDWMGGVFELPQITPAAFVGVADQTQKDGGIIILHKNDSRFKLNATLRKNRGLPDGDIAYREPLLVIQNNYNLDRFNGEVVSFEGWDYSSTRTYDIYDPISKDVYKTRLGRAKVDGKEVVLAVAQVFGEMEKVSKSRIEAVAKANVSMNEDEKVGFMHANFGYALTAHKAQGSEWDKVLVGVEPSIRPETEEGGRWLYTSLTRAAKEVALCWGPVISS